jgi:hypothetical protein
VNVLSPQGKIELVNGPQEALGANQVPGRPIVVLTEAPHLIAGVNALIDSLDVPVPQFEIEVKFVETDLDDDLNVGFSWPTRIDASIATEAPETDETETQVFPSAKYPIDGKSGSLERLMSTVDGFVEFCTNGWARILSDPRVTVLENEKAVMQVTTTIPVQTDRFTEGAVIQDIVVSGMDVASHCGDAARTPINVSRSTSNGVEEIPVYRSADNERPISEAAGHTRVRVADEKRCHRRFGQKTKPRRVAVRFRQHPDSRRPFTHKVKSQKTDLLMFITLASNDNEYNCRVQICLPEG